MRAHQCSPRRFMPPGTCSYPPHSALTHARPLPPSSSSLVLSVVPPDHLPMQRLSVPPGVPAGRSISHTSALLAPSTVASAALFAGLPPWDRHGTLLGAAPPTSSLAALHTWATLRLDRKCRDPAALLLPLGGAHRCRSSSGSPPWLPLTLPGSADPDPPLGSTPLLCLPGSLAVWGILHVAFSLGWEAHRA